MEQIQNAVLAAFEEFKKEFGENAKLEEGDEFVTVFNNCTLITDEELYCIRWHMGAFDDKENWNSYGRAVTNFPNVLYTHTADMVAARILGV